MGKGFEIVISTIRCTITVLGKPLVLWLRALALVFLLITAIIVFLNHKGIRTTPFKWHPRMAVLAIIIVAVHASLALMA